MKTSLPKSVMEVIALILVKGNVILQVVQSIEIKVNIQLQT